MANIPVTAAKGGVLGAGTDQRAKLKDLTAAQPKEMLQGVKDKLAQNRQTQLQKAMEMLLTGTNEEHSAIHHTLKDVMKNMKSGGEKGAGEYGAGEGGEMNDPKDLHAELEKLMEKYKPKESNQQAKLRPSVQQSRPMQPDRTTATLFNRMTAQNMNPARQRPPSMDLYNATSYPGSYAPTTMPRSQTAVPMTNPQRPINNGMRSPTPMNY